MSVPVSCELWFNDVRVCLSVCLFVGSSEPLPGGGGSARSLQHGVVCSLGDAPCSCPPAARLVPACARHSARPRLPRPPLGARPRSRHALRVTRGGSESLRVAPEAPSPGRVSRTRSRPACRGWDGPVQAPAKGSVTLFTGQHTLICALTFGCLFSSSEVIHG